MSRRRRALFGAALAACLAMTPGVMPSAHAAGDSGRYVSGGTAAARANGQPVADEGSVVCDAGDGIGAGGACLAFGGGDAVEVFDDAAGQDVPFQVCLDNNGDGVCTSPDFGVCADQVFFSHDDAGNFFNPVGPLPTGFAPGCDGGPWSGYVVFLCEGAHVASDTHTHPATTGTATVTSGGEGQGTFCGGMPVNQSRKRYTVGSGARYVSGGTAVAREDGQPVVDEGAVVCNNGDNTGVGGFCTSFGGGDSMAVFDATATDVAFQVCVDNNGDGVCTSPDTSWTCPDQVFFSHDDGGAFYNPLGPLPTGFSPGCGNGAWNGYVVFLCEGTHVDGLSPHAHAATTGTGRVTTGGEGLGTFCGGSHATPSRKRYQLDLTPDVEPVDPVTMISGGGDCTLRAVHESRNTGQNFEGTLSVLVTSPDPTSSVTDVRCDLLVNGSQTGAAVEAPDGIGFAAASGPASFAATPQDAVTLCTSGRIDGVPFHRCSDTETTQVPPQEVEDAVDALFEAVDQLPGEAGSQVDAATCPLLVALSVGIPGILEITPEGDVFLRGELLLDCPPYVV